MNRLNRILTAVLVLALLATAAGAAIASSRTVEAVLTYRDIHITLDGQELLPTDVNGNYVEPFILDGTTYLPVRGVASALGLEVSWDAETNTVALERGTEEIAMYRVDYDGRQDFYEGAKDAYAAGEQVTLYCSMIATDTDYTFLLDGETINVDYDESKGFVIRFVMPDHDVKLECNMRNTMVYVPEMIDTLAFDSFDGGGPSFTVVIEDPAIVSCDRVREYHNPDHDNMTGSGYTEVFTFTGLRPGQTTVTVQARSPIADNFDAVYLVTVYDDLGVSLDQESFLDLME